MIEEIIYTSAPHGLKAGSKGFCTVAGTPGMASTLATLLESLSGYRHLAELGSAEVGRNPIVFSHLKSRVGGRGLHILSRIADAGLDYSGRSNKIAHHVVLSPQTLPPGGPAALQSDASFHETIWSGEPRLITDGRALPPGNVVPAVCDYWREVTGDASWGGVCAEAFQKPAPAEFWMIAPADVDVLRLLRESLAILPPAAPWNATYTTFYTKLPPGIECRLRCAIDGTPEAEQLRKRYELNALDLCRRHDAPPQSEWTEAACTGIPPRQILIQSAASATPPPDAMASTDESPYEVDLSDFAQTSPPPLPGIRNSSARIQSGRAIGQGHCKSERRKVWPIALAAAIVLTLCLGTMVLTYKPFQRATVRLFHGETVKNHQSRSIGSITIQKPLTPPVEQPSPVEKSPGESIEIADDETQDDETSNSPSQTEQIVTNDAVRTPTQNEPGSQNGKSGVTPRSDPHKNDDVSRNNERSNESDHTTSNKSVDPDGHALISHRPQIFDLTEMKTTTDGNLQPMNLSFSGNSNVETQNVEVQLLQPADGDENGRLKYDPNTRSFREFSKDFKFGGLSLQSKSAQIEFQIKKRTPLERRLRSCVLRITLASSDGLSSETYDYAFRNRVSFSLLPKSLDNLLSPDSWQTEVSLEELPSATDSQLRVISGAKNQLIAVLEFTREGASEQQIPIIDSLPCGNSAIQLKLLPKLLKDGELLRIQCRLFVSDNSKPIEFSRLVTWQTKMQEFGRHFKGMDGKALGTLSMDVVLSMLEKRSHDEKNKDAKRMYKDCDSPPLSDSGGDIVYAARTGAYSVSNSSGDL